MTDAGTTGSDLPTLLGEPTQPRGAETLTGNARVSASSPSRFGRGDMLGRYVVLGTVGQGGMGIVYAAYDPDLDRKVAIKLVRSTLDRGEAARLRLQREAQAIARLSHPNVVHVHDVGVVGDRVFIAMEFVEGLDLGRWLAAQERSIPEIVACFDQAGRGLAAAHAAGLVHRDFKPDNVLVGVDGRVRVVDFGLVRSDGDDDGGARLSLDEADAQIVAEVADGPRRTGPTIDLTVTGALMGTPGYMSPEQFAGRPGDARSDQFSLCVALYEALYGERPFAGETLAELGHAVLHGEIRSPTSARVPPRLRRALVKGLSVEPSSRYPDVAALSTALARAVAPRRGRWLAAAAVAVVGGSLATWAGLREGRPCDALAGRAAAQWSPERRARIESRFLAIDRPFAADAWERVRGRLDEHTARWADQQRETCEASSGVELDPVEQGRQECLDEGLHELGVVLELFDEADLDTVLRATKLVHSLSAPDACAEADLQRLVPGDPALRERVQQLRAELGRVRVLTRGGHRDEAERRLDALLVEAGVVDYAPLTAELQAWHAELVSGAGDLDTGLSLANEAFELALASRNDRVAFDTAVDLMHMHGVDRRERAEALRWARRAEAMLHRLGERDQQRVALLNGRAAVYAQNNDGAEAKAQYIELVALVRGLDQPMMLSVVLNNLGGVLTSLREYDAAIAALEESLSISEALRGPDHPHALSTQANIGMVRLQQGDYEVGRRVLEQVLPRQRAALSPEHPEVVNTLDGLGVATLAMGELALSEDHRRLVLRYREQVFGRRSVPTMLALVNLSTLLAVRGRFDEVLVITDELLAEIRGWPEPLPSLHGRTLVSSCIALLALDRNERALVHADELDGVCGAEADACSYDERQWAWVLRGAARVANGDRAGAVAILEPRLEGLADVDDALSAYASALARFSLASALVDEPQRHAAAVELARTAERALDPQRPREAQLAARIEAWRREHP